MKYSRECMYCKHFFKCAGKDVWIDRCIEFEASNSDAQKRHDEVMGDSNGKQTHT